MVRPVTPADRADWLRMRSALWPDDHAREVDAFLAGDTRIAEAVLLAVAGGAAVGFVEVGLRSYAEGCETSPVGYVEGWYVEAAWRRRGVGRALLDAAAAWALARGLSELGSDADLANTDSQAAHRACGFEEVQRVVTFRRRLRP
jgi:aminoglycoside 6'-N-acetyltransferase I